MNPIFQALSQGHNPQQILRYLSRAIPNMASPIAKATSSGYNAKQILGFLSKNFEEDKRGMSESQIHASNRRSDSERTKFGLTMAGGAAASYALSRALPSAVQGLLGGGQPQTPGPANAIPGALQTPPQQQIQTPIVQQPSQPPNAPIPGAPVTPNQPAAPTAQPNTNITQPPNIQQPQISSINANQVLSSHKLSQKVDDILKSGNGPKEVAGYFNSFHPKEMKEIEKETGMPFEQVIEKYITEKPKEAEQEPTNVLPESNELVKEKPDLLQEARELFEKTGNLSPTFIQRKLKIKYADASKLVDELKKEGLKEAEEEKVLPIEEENKPIAKNETVITPHGVGEVKSIKDKSALIDIDGKLHKVPVEELETSPLPEKEMADIYEDLKKKIESETGEEMSRHVTFLGYDPNMKQLIYMPWRGQPYTYNDVTDEEIADLKDKIDRKTSGENFIGAYQEGTESPIGAAMSEFIQRRKAAQKEKGVEKKEPIHKAKFEKLYYAYEPAEKAAEARYKERKKQSKKNT